MLYQIYLSPKVKRCATITYKLDISQLPHELVNDLKIYTLRRLGKISKVCKFHRITA